MSRLYADEDDDVYPALIFHVEFHSDVAQTSFGEWATNKIERSIDTYIYSNQYQIT